MEDLLDDNTINIVDSSLKHFSLQDVADNENTWLHSAPRILWDSRMALSRWMAALQSSIYVLSLMMSKRRRVLRLPTAGGHQTKRPARWDAQKSNALTQFAIVPLFFKDN